MHVQFLVYQRHAFPLPGLMGSCFQFVLELCVKCELSFMQVRRVSAGCGANGLVATSVEFWSHSPARPSAHFTHGNCRCHYMSLLELGRQCVHVTAVGSITVWGCSMRIPPQSPVCLFQC